MINDKVSKFSVILFGIFFNLFFSLYYCLPFLLDNVGSSLWIMLILLAFPISIPLLLFKRKTKLPSPNRFMNIINGLYLFFSSGIIIAFAMDILTGFLFAEVSFYPLAIPFIITILYLESKGPQSIFHVSTIFFVVGIALIIFSIGINFEQINSSFLLPISINRNIYKILILIILPLDLLYIKYYSAIFEEKESGIYWKSFLISLSVLLIYVVLGQSIYGFGFLNSFDYPGFSAFESHGLNFFGQFDFLYLYIIVISCVFSVALRLNLIRLFYKIKMTLITKIVSFLFVYIIAKFIYNFNIKNLLWIGTLPLINFFYLLGGKNDKENN